MWYRETQETEPVALIDQFLSFHKERGSFTARETVDILLDVRNAINKENNGSLQEGSDTLDRPDTDDSEPTHGSVLVGAESKDHLP